MLGATLAVVARKWRGCCSATKSIHVTRQCVHASSLRCEISQSVSYHVACSTTANRPNMAGRVYQGLV